MRIVVVAWALTGAVSLADVPDLPQTPPERIRAGYLGPKDQALLEPMARAGFNTVLVKIGDITVPLTDGSKELLNSWAKACAALGMAFCPTINMFGGHEPSWVKGYVPLVNDEGVVLPKTPDPLVREFWDKYVTARLTGIVEALGDCPPAAVMIDLEMYGAEHSTYLGLSYSDAALTPFLADQRPGAKLPEAGKRPEWIKQEGLLEALTAYQRGVLKQRATECREAVHKLRPGLRLAAYHLDQFYPLVEGLAQGFGTAELPVLCLTEKTYSSGFDKYVTTEGPETFAKLGAHVDWLIGLWQTKIPPENIAGHAYHCARASVGYWVYTMQTFLNPKYHALEAPAEDYWQAYRVAHAELDKAAANPAHASALKAERFHAPLPKPEAVLPTIALRPVPGERPAVPAKLPCLRGSNTLLLWVGAGETIAVECRMKQVGRYPDLARLALVGPGGVPLSEIKLGMDQPSTITAKAEAEGLYALAVAAGANAVEVLKLSHPAAISTEKVAGLLGACPPLYLQPTAGSRQVKLMLGTDNKQEGKHIEITAADGQVLWSGDIAAPTDVVLDLKDSAGPLKVVASKADDARVEEDYKLKVLAGAVPVVAAEPAGLLLEK